MKSFTIPGAFLTRLVNRRTALIFGVFIALISTSAFLSHSTLSRGSAAGRAGSETANDAGLPRLPKPPAQAFHSVPKPIFDAPASASTLYVNPDGVCGGNSLCFTTIQAAINAAAPGDTINVAAATYAEQININKALTLLGPNANVDPNTGSRGAEAVIIPTASDPLNVSFGGPRVVTLSAAGITFDGFTVDGNNPSLISGVVYNGQDVDAEFGIYGDGSANPDAVISNNIVKNIGEIAVWINTFSLGGTRNSNSRITNNKVDNNLGNFGQGIRISDDAWLDVTNNVVNLVRVGIVIENYSGNVTTHPASVISNNTVTSFHIGIRHNLHYVYSAPGFTISNNIVSPYVQSPIPPQVTSPTTYEGIRVESIQQTVAVTISDNVLTGNRTAMSAGGYTRNEGLGLSNASCTSPNIVFNLNNVSDFVRGVFNDTPAVPTFACNQIRSNTTGVYLSANATNGLIANNNDIAGNGFGLQNDGPATVNAQSNWWGAANGPGPVGPGSGDQVSTNVDFSSFLTSAAPCADHPPVVTTTADGVVSYTECDSPAVVDSGLTVTDSDNTTLSSGTVSITNNYQAGEDVLAFANSNGTEFGNIQVNSYSGGVLSLSSPGQTATVAEWQNALRAVTYSNTAANPNTSIRTVSFVANDGTNSSTAATQDLSVTGVTTPTITPGGPTTFCTGGSVTLNSSAATGNQWYLNGNPIGGATNQQYLATASGSYTVATGCAVNASVPVVVTVNSNPATPTITPGGPTTFCAGGSVTLTSSSASGNQWYLNGNPIGGATNQTYDATGSGSYTVVVTALGCSSAPSASTIVTVQPSVLTVTNTNDSGSGSLRDAIANVCVGGTINFDPALNGQAITLTSGQLVINKNLTITGPGANLLTISGNNTLRVFNVSSATVAISGLTISQGLANASSSPTNLGGGIYNNGNLTLNSCVVTANNASSGGGIFNPTGGILNINNSTISGNTATAAGGGGGIANFNGGTLNLSNSTISGNTANGQGGGVFNQNSNAILINSTISGNTAGSGGDGGGILNSASSGGTATVTLTNCTITGNTALRGSAIVTADLFNNAIKAETLIGNSLVGGNHGPNFFTSGTQGKVTDKGNNLDSDGTSGLVNGTNGNKVGTAGSPLNALLAPLANYGGPTQTHALLPGSPALDAGGNTAANDAELTTDQRGPGFARIVNGTVDIGAFESRGFTIVATSGTPQSAQIFSAFAASLLANVSGTGGEPVAGGVVIFTAPASGPSAVLSGGGATFNATINGSGQVSSTATANATAGGPYIVTATANGVAAPAPFTLTNTKAPTATSVSSSVNPSDLNQSVTFRADVSSVAAKTGTVQFKDNGINMGAPATLDDSGVALFTTSSLTAGTHTITADYSGDANFLPSTGTLAGGQVVRAQPSLSINNVAIAEGNSGTQVLNFTATLSAASNLTVTASFNTANGTATSGSDYVAANGAATFNPGETTRTIPVTINGDVDFEADETFTVNLSNPVNATISANQGLGTIQNDDALGGFISFSQANTSVNESTGLVTLTVTRGLISFGKAHTQDVLEAANVDYATDDTGASTNCAALNSGLASQRCDYTSVFGTLKFAANETEKTIEIPITLDAYNEGPEVFTVKLSNPTGDAVAVPSTATVTIDDSASPTPNAIDDTTNFVRQQYRDFLNREADAEGLAFWKDNIDKCNDPARRPANQTVAQCIEVQRIVTSAAFFLSIEFKQTGGLVRDFYVAALNRPATNNMPNYVEFMRDTQAIQKGVVVGQGNWQQVLDANRAAFMNEFVTRAEFVALYPTTDTPTQYVDKLYQHAGVSPTNPGERAAAIAEFGGAATAADPGARARALLRVTQNAAFQAREANRAFVQIEYFGYLRRNPNDAPDGNFNGYNFWVAKLNQFNGNFLDAEMVKAFLNSLEYRGRFGP